MGVKQAVWPAMYLAALQLDGLKGTLLVRAKLDARQLAALVSGELRQTDPAARIEHQTTLEAAVNSMISRERLVAYLSAAFGGLAAPLAVIGLYGVMAYNMSRRTSEIGLRIALGARPSDIRRLVLGESLRLIALGLAFGFAVVLASGRLVRALLYNMSPSDPWVLGTAGLAMLGELSASVRKYAGQGQCLPLRPLAWST